MDVDVDADGDGDGDGDGDVDVNADGDAEVDGKESAVDSVERAFTKNPPFRAEPTVLPCLALRHGFWAAVEQNVQRKIDKNS
ncbi:hypothetical protein [Streptomyces auratus]|uniref:hypothetical protein n=1 Tax=Streptomyces auratus TaxID=114687 RepID=UPI001FEC8119|nr:hypothetical protein [Streptomyces auratus]